MGLTRTDRWVDVGDRWPGRLALVASLIPPRSSVADLGAGAQGLRALLPRGCTYHPFDLPEFDMNEDLWPTGRYDVAVMAGVLEYADRPGVVFRRLRHLATMSLVTYAHSKDRRDNDWNSLTEAKFALLARRVGLRPARVATWATEDIAAQAVWRLT